MEALFVDGEQGLIVPLCLVVVRLLPLAVVPWLSWGVPWLARLGVVGAFVLASFPTAMAGCQATPVGGQLLIVGFSQLSFGVLTAVLFGVVLWGLDMGAHLVDGVMGRVRSLSPAGPSSPSATLLTYAAIAAVMASGAHLFAVEGVVRGVATQPVCAPVSAEVFASVEGLVAITTDALVVATALALPVFAVTWLVDVAIAALDRIEPTLAAMLLSASPRRLLATACLFLVAWAALEWGPASLVDAASVLDGLVEVGDP